MNPFLATVAQNQILVNSLLTIHHIQITLFKFWHYRNF